MRVGQISFVNFASKIVSSVVGFLATIYLARTLNPEVLGTYFLVIAVVIWFQVIGLMGVQSAVTKRLSEKGNDNAYFTAGAIIAFTSFCVISVAIVVFSGFVNQYIGAEVAHLIVFLLLSGIALKFVSAALEGKHLVHVAALLLPVDRILRSIVQVIAVFLGFSLVGLLFGYVVAGLVASVIGLVFLSTKFKLPERQHFTHLLSYARYSWLGKLGTRTFASMDTVVLGFFVTSNLIGFYEIAWNLATILAMFGVAISQTLFPEISRIASSGDTERIEGLVNEALTYTGLLLIPGVVGCFLVGDFVLSIYGSEFKRAQTVLFLLVIARLLYAYGNQFLNVLNGIDRPDLTFRINGVFVVTNVSLNVLFVQLYGWIGAAIATTVSALLALLIGYHALKRFIRVPVPTSEIVKQCIAAAGMGFVVYFARIQSEQSLLTTLSLVVIGAVSYFALLLLISKHFRVTVYRNVSALKSA